MVNPVEHRYKDEEARAQATRSLLNCIVENRMAVGSLPPSERDAVRSLSHHFEGVYFCIVFIAFSCLTSFILQVYNECSKAEQWLRERTQLQDSLPKNADPTLSSSEIRRRTEALDVYVCFLVELAHYLIWLILG